MNNCNEYLKKAQVKKVNSPDAFNLQKYIEKDCSKEKQRAELRGSGNYAELIKKNMRRP